MKRLTVHRLYLKCPVWRTAPPPLTGTITIHGGGFEASSSYRFQTKYFHKFACKKEVKYLPVEPFHGIVKDWIGSPLYEISRQAPLDYAMDHNFGIILNIMFCLMLLLNGAFVLNLSRVKEYFYFLHQKNVKANLRCKLESNVKFRKDVRTRI